MSSTRSIIAPPTFAANALTVIPPTPVAGVSYRDPAAGPASSPDGWPYAERVNSAEFNQIMYQMSGLLSILDSKGILGWSSAVDYTVAGVQFGSDGNLYKWVSASGPNNGGAKDPVTDTANTYWKIAFVDSTALNAALAASSPVVGGSRNLRMTVAAASASATITADQIIVSSSLSGNVHKLSSFSKVINLATTGAGGMDTGAAPVSGYVAIYAIYNPTTAVSALLATNATAAAQPEVYGGANMPAGYTASALVSVWGTTGASLLRVGSQYERRIHFPLVTAASFLSILVNSPISISAVVPRNAVRIGGDIGGVSTVSSTLTIDVFADANLSGRRSTQWGGSGTASGTASFELDIFVAQTVYSSTTNTSGTPTFRINLSSYEF